MGVKVPSARLRLPATLASCPLEEILWELGEWYERRMLLLWNLSWHPFPAQPSSGPAHHCGASQG